jgi:hypothetical protein
MEPFMMFCSMAARSLNCFGTIQHNGDSIVAIGCSGTAYVGVVGQNGPYSRVRGFVPHLFFEFSFFRGTIRRWKRGRMEGRKDGTLRHAQGRGWSEPRTIDDGRWQFDEGGWFFNTKGTKGTTKVTKECCFLCDPWWVGSETWW